MADAITSVPVGQGAEEFILKPFYEDPSITQLGMDVKVVKKIMKLYFNTQLDDITYKKESCGWNYSGGAAITPKTVQQIELAAAIEQCYQEFLDTYFADGLPAGAARGELSPEIQDLLLQLFNDAFKRDVLRFLFLGDTALVSSKYNAMDGVYKKLAADVNIVNAGTITDTDLQLANIEATMYNIYNSQPDILRSIPDENKVFWVTGSVYDAWKRYLQINTGNQIVIQRDGVIQGIANSDVRYQNIPLVPLRFVDRLLAADFTSGSPAVVDNPHRVILTDPTNHHLALDKSSFGDARTWYSNDDDKFRVAGSALIAYEYGYSELQVIAGF